MVTNAHGWIILFAPLAAAVIITLFLLRAHKVAALTALCGILISFAASVNLFVESLLDHHFLPIEISFPWIRTQVFSTDFGFTLDSLSVLMLLVVTGVGSCIFAYSIGYMKGDTSYPRYFAYLSLFAFSMLGIVLANNFFMLFIFWELVAVSSYLLIGFWFEKPSAADAGNKAFIVNRVGDFGLLIGILFVWTLSAPDAGNRTFLFSKLAEVLPAGVSAGTISHAAMAIATLLIFCGVAGKSAQFPLYVWLPDAMEGPTPVSALIHAATMVAAGIYLACRVFFIISVSHTALLVIAVLGCVTAVITGFLAIVQNDIKKVLAYSTISQLGFMAMALGLGSANVSMFHLTTHAFFKALLFLGAGSLIHAMHTQDIWEMGGTLKKMPITSITFLLGALALSGVWPLAGFFSKDEILALAWEHNRALFFAGLVAAMTTAFYMTRVLWVAVLGPSRAHGHHHPHESPPIMAIPLVLLGVLTVTGGFIGIPAFLSGHLLPHHVDRVVPILSTVAALSGIALGSLVYARAPKQDPLLKIPAFIRTTLLQKYYLDDLFLAIANLFQKAIAQVLFWFDLKAVMGVMVAGSASVTRLSGAALRRLQTGRVQDYALTLFGGVLIMLFFVLRMK